TLPYCYVRQPATFVTYVHGAIGNQRTFWGLTDMADLPYKRRKLVWLGDSKEAISAFPLEVKKGLGFALRLVQNGETPDIAKPLTDYSGVYELKTNDADNTYRAVYALKLGKAVYVLDVFIKKSKTGKKIPREVKERIEKRIKRAREMDVE
ncbi:MAG: type II toxin-antitoxin system RelE/ParE family toxin, partial [Terriglobia bacterium]